MLFALNLKYVLKLFSSMALEAIIFLTNTIKRNKISYVAVRQIPSIIQQNMTVTY